jgi:transcription-repair coupling factor (superfamily II helicase)
MWLYKRVASAPDPSALERLREEVRDRFGSCPAAVENLFGYARLKLKARRLRITAVEFKGGRVALRFEADTPVSAERMVGLVGRRKGWSLAPEGVLTVLLPAAEPGVLVGEVDRLLDEIAVLE